MAKAKSIKSNPTQDSADDQADLPHAKDIFAPEDVGNTPIFSGAHEQSLSQHR
jgi:hypothetical protein